jgi:hypothetical protein
MENNHLTTNKAACQPILENPFENNTSSYLKR